MAVRASVSQARISAGVLFAFIVAVLAAMLIGGTAGYLVRVVSVPASTSTTTHASPRPFVVEQAPYSTPKTSPIPEPTRDPKGNVVPI
ncbi:MAG TPA: hypothetical protein VHM88_15435 [Candidatus Acidoferrales bacterium]|jgi:hypothetical protein|nr:hypothetical protein [Candidatus Dormibacteraeota bacterium]HEX2713592.1 hypothetical protein [Candidatus Acidoferrales bacterium]